MNALEIISKAESDGLHLNLSSNGKIKVAGNESSINKWQSAIQENKLTIIRVLREFNTLYNYLAPLMKWGDEDYQAWRTDLVEQPEITMGCLRAIKMSALEGRLGNLIQSDWVH